MLISPLCMGILIVKIPVVIRHGPNLIRQQCSLRNTFSRDDITIDFNSDADHTEVAYPCWAEIVQNGHIRGWLDISRPGVSLHELSNHIYTLVISNDRPYEIGLVHLHEYCHITHILCLLTKNVQLLRDIS